MGDVNPESALSGHSQTRPEGASGKALEPTQSHVDPKSAAVSRAMKKIAESTPETVVEMTTMMSGMMGHPIHQKMDGSHITKMLDLAIQHDSNEFTLRKNQQTIDSDNYKREQFSERFYFFIFIGLVLVVLALFKSQPTVLVPLISGIGGAALGFVGGVGHGRANPKRIPKTSDSD